VRIIAPDDASSVIELAVSSGLFPAEESHIVRTMMANYFGRGRDEGHVCVIDEDDGPSGVAYYEPAVATDRTWYLTMIAVHADRQGRGRGSALLRGVEEELRARDQRLLLVETSGTPGFARTRAFYRRCGYQQEAQVRDYYEADDDLVLFRKALTA
jgi:ribosomal protein S18 acetylase RimI-like enzyme